MSLHCLIGTARQSKKKNNKSCVFTHRNATSESWKRNSAGGKNNGNAHKRKQTKKKSEWKQKRNEEKREAGRAQRKQ